MCLDKLHLHPQVLKAKGGRGLGITYRMVTLPVSPPEPASWSDSSGQSAGSGQASPARPGTQSQRGERLRDNLPNGDPPSLASRAWVMVR